MGALAALTPRQRVYIVCHYVLDMPPREIAQAAGVSDGTIKSTEGIDGRPRERQVAQAEQSSTGGVVLGREVDRALLRSGEVHVAAAELTPP